MKSVILYNGSAVASELLIDPKFSINGYLSSFKTLEGKKYVHLNRRYFRNDPIEQDASRPGYYEEVAFAQHISNPNEYPLIELKKDRYNFSPARPGDQIEVSMADFNTENPQFYRKRVFRFTHQESNRYLGSRDGVLRTTDMGTPDPSSIVPQSAESTGFFNNHKDGLDALPDENAKRDYLEDLVVASLLIGSIKRIIFPIILHEASSCTELTALVDNLQADWRTEKLFGPTTNPEELQDYKEGLYNFYRSVYKNQNLVRAFSCQKRLLKLFKLLPIKTLKTVPVESKIQALNLYLGDETFRENDDHLVLNILTSTEQDTNVNAMMDYLESTIETSKYFAIYSVLDTGRINRYTFGLAGEQPIQKHYVYLVYNLWKKSRYNAAYIPEGVTANEDGLNPNAFFLSDAAENFRADSTVLEFGVRSERGPDNAYQTTRTTNYEPVSDIDGNVITINKESSSTQIRIKNVPAFSDGSLSTSQSTFYGKYHIFQSITLIGYKPDLELTIPNGDPIPAFLLHYAKEFEDLKEFDAAVVLTAEIALEVGLLFFTGGISTIRHLRHLRHVSGVVKVIKNGLTTADKILIWRGLEGASEVVAVTAGMITSFNTYLASITNYPEERAAAEKTAQTFMWLAIFSAGTAAAGRLKTAQAASEAIDEINLLTTNNITVNLPTGIEEILRTIKASNLLDATLFKQTLGSYGDDILGNGVPNKLLSTYNEFTEPARIAFRKEHGLVKDPDFWRKLNEEDAYLLDKWEDLWQQMITDRLLPDFLKEKVLVDGIIKYYSEALIRTALEPLDNPTRSEFLRSFGDTTQEVFDGFNNRPSKITEWGEATGGERTLALDYDYLWSRSKLDLVQIRDLNHFVIQIRKKIFVDHQFALEFFKGIEPSDKVKALEYLKNGRRVTVGNYIEELAKEYIRLNLTNTEQGFVSADIKFFDKDGVLLNKSGIRDIDGLIYDTEQKKFTKILSCKFPINATKRQDEIDYLLAYGGIPVGDTDNLLNYLSTQELLKNKSWKGKNKSFTYEIRMTDVETRKEVIMESDEFIRSLKDSYSIDDVKEINSNSFETTNEEIILGIYNFIRK